MFNEVFIWLAKVDDELLNSLLHRLQYQISLFTAHWQVNVYRVLHTDDRALSVLQEFREMLHKQATVEAFIEWLDVSIQQKILVKCFIIIVNSFDPSSTSQWHFNAAKQRCEHISCLNS